MARDLVALADQDAVGKLEIGGQLGEVIEVVLGNVHVTHQGCCHRKKDEIVTMKKRPLIGIHNQLKN